MHREVALGVYKNNTILMENKNNPNILPSTFEIFFQRL